VTEVVIEVATEVVVEVVVEEVEVVADEAKDGVEMDRVSADCDCDRGEAAVAAAAARTAAGGIGWFDCRALMGFAFLGEVRGDPGADIDSDAPAVEATGTAGTEVFCFTSVSVAVSMTVAVFMTADLDSVLVSVFDLVPALVFVSLSCTSLSGSVDSPRSAMRRPCRDASPPTEVL
jgi:hypothetical protein